MEYQRILLASLKKWFFKGKVLVITGARQVGKTTMLETINTEHDSVLWLNADLTNVRNQLTDPTLSDLENLIGSKRFVIIDEIQRIKNPGLLLKLMVDNFKKTQFIATGSSALEISEKIFEPLTGRHLLFHLYPFSLAEIYTGKSNFEIENEFPFHLIYGSYPSISQNRSDAEILLKNLTSQYLYKDVLVWKDIRKPELLEKLLELLAHQLCSEVSIHELAINLRVKPETVENYLDLLEKSFVIYRLRAYSTNARKEVTKMNKILFWDNGIRNAIIDDFRAISNRNDTGSLWENFIITERMKMINWKGKSIKSHFWRNLQQREVDYVELKKNKLYGFEIKWNTKKNNSVTKSFTNLYPKAQTEIITPTNFHKFCFDID